MHLTDEKKVYGHFQQDSTAAHTAWYSMQTLHEVFDDTVIRRGLWPPRSPDMNPCGFFYGDA
jgi:hypothetical protein